MLSFYLYRENNESKKTETMKSKHMHIAKKNTIIILIARIFRDQRIEGLNSIQKIVYKVLYLFYMKLYSCVGVCYL